MAEYQNGADEGPLNHGSGMATVPGPAPKSKSYPGPGVSLGESLSRSGRHPILVFGSAYSGKSMLIMSIIQALQTARTVHVALGEPVFDLADPRCDEMHRRAKDLYDRGAYTTAGGEPLKATQGEPFFIPIDIKPRNSRLEPVKLAFLDGRGEAYEPNHDGAADLYKPLGDDIRELLQTFPDGISMVYVAPYSISAGHERDTHDSNFGLLGALREYQELRKRRRNDFHLFLLTKWDQRAPALGDNELFAQVDPSDVDAVLSDRYAHSWGEFQGLPLEGPANDRRTFMQYCSGYFVGGKPRMPPSALADDYRRYPKLLINWLYGNARRYKIQIDKRPAILRWTIFDDVASSDDMQVSITDRLARILTAR